MAEGEEADEEDDFDYFDIEDDDFCDELDEDVEDDLINDPDFRDCGTYWLAVDDRERAVQVAAHRALKRAEEEQLRYLSLPTSSGAKKRAKAAFEEKWQVYKQLENALNARNFNTIDHVDGGGDGADGVTLEGPKSSRVEPNTAVEKGHSPEATVIGDAFPCSSTTPTPVAVSSSSSKCAKRKAQRYQQPNSC